MSDLLRCPKCGSPDVECDDGRVHYCAACGYDGRTQHFAQRIAELEAEGERLRDWGNVEDTVVSDLIYVLGDAYTEEECDTLADLVEEVRREVRRLRKIEDLARTLVGVTIGPGPRGAEGIVSALRTALHPEEQSDE